MNSDIVIVADIETVKDLWFSPNFPPTSGRRPSAGVLLLGRFGDGGVDGVINEDRLGLDRVYVQAKRFAHGNTADRPEVQAFVGCLVGLGATKGVFLTTSTFKSTSARICAAPIPAHHPA